MIANTNSAVAGTSTINLGGCLRDRKCFLTVAVFAVIAGLG